MDTVLKVLEAHNASRTSALTEVNLLVSIDRRETAEEARATVELACAAKEAGRPVVGIDLSGNPALGKNAMLTYGDALSLARAAGLRTTLHFAEVDNPEEVGAMLEFKPDRLGHAVCLGAAQKEALFEAGIPVEICLTSNKITESVASYADHHLGEFLERRHPVSICTDDSGVFETTSAQEHAIAAATFGLSEAELLRLSRAAVDQTFAGAATKARLRAVFDAFAIESVNELNK